MRSDTASAGTTMKRQVACIVLISLAIGLILLPVGYGNSARTSTAGDQAAILVGAGDIADCADLSGAEATARLLEKIPGTVMAVGDLAYPRGTKEQFGNCYDKTCGRVKSRTRPAAGNHEFRS